MKKKFISKNKNIILLLIIIIAFLLISAAVYTTVININIYNATSDNIISINQAKEKKAECIIVLGTTANDDGSPGVVLEKRLSKGVELFNQNVSDKIIMSGSQRENYDEITPMVRYAYNSGIPLSKIFSDKDGYTTSESIYRAKKVFNLKRIVIVSQRYHLYRALYIAHSIGLEAYGVPAEDSGFIKQVYSNIREVFARIKDYLLLKYREVPSYPNENINIFGIIEKQ